MKITIVLFIVALSLTSVYAQKLPIIQQNSLRAPANLKIDGKAADWGANLQAYNPAVEVSYAIANDDSNLYLIVQTQKPRIFEKIVNVGVTFTINKNGSKEYKNKDNAIITFPLLDIPTGTRIIGAAGIKSDNVLGVLRGPRGNIQMPDLIYNELQSDSLKMVAAKILKSESKTIKVTGFDGLPDTISIYNEHNVLTAVDYENGIYTYELQLPIKLLKLTTNTKLFAYSIKLRSRLEDKKKGVLAVYKYDKAGNEINANADLDADADFWGEYALAK